MGLSGAVRRAGELLAQTPLLFVGVVVAIAVVFRLGIGVLRGPAEAEAEAAREVVMPASSTEESASTRSTKAGSTVETSTAVGPERPVPGPADSRGKRHPRNHGRR